MNQTTKLRSTTVSIWSFLTPLRIRKSSVRVWSRKVRQNQINSGAPLLMWGYLVWLLSGVNVGVHPQLGLGHKPLATDVAGVLAAHVMALDVVLQGVLGLEHPAAAGTVEGRLAVLVVHVCLCTKQYRYKFNFIILVKQVHFFRKCCEKNPFSFSLVYCTPKSYLNSFSTWSFRHTLRRWRAGQLCALI